MSKIFSLKKVLVISLFLMFLLAGLWFFQISTLAKESEKLAKAQEKLSSLKQLKITSSSPKADYEVEQLAQALDFEKIKDVYYIKVSESTVLAK